MASPVSGSSAPLQPTFNGYVDSTMSALVLFESCLRGILQHAPRRPHDRERSDLIRSGNVFIYEEQASGIKRWTDGVNWSPSRILGNFLVYRELERAFNPGEKKRANKKTKRPTNGGISKSQSDLSRPSAIGMPPNGSNAASLIEGGSSTPGLTKEEERALIGSLIESYPFKAGGLVKKTISITYQGVQHHLVSYYTIDDCMNQRLSLPYAYPATRGILPRMALYTDQSFRAPLENISFGEQLGAPMDYTVAGTMPGSAIPMAGAISEAIHIPMPMHMTSYLQPAMGHSTALVPAPPVLHQQPVAPIHHFLGPTQFGGFEPAGSVVPTYPVLPFSLQPHDQSVFNDQEAKEENTCYPAWYNHPGP